MILSKARRYTLLASLMCLLLMTFAGASYAAIRWQVVSAPTEVITSGRSEVTGSVTLIVEPGQGPVLTGNVAGGSTQIAILYNEPLLQIDNTTSTGIRAGIYRQVVSGSTLITTLLYDFVANAAIDVRNIDLGCSAVCFAGQVTLNLPPNFPLLENDFIRVDGVRVRVDLSELANPTRDAFVRLQSINDPAANQFTIDRIRVATSFLPMTVRITAATAVLCLPPFGNPLTDPTGGPIHTTSAITVSERFNRAFVARDSNGAGPDLTDRLDTQGLILGSPTNGTMLKIMLNNIPASVTGVSWPTEVSSGWGVFVLRTGTATNCTSTTNSGFGPCFSAAVLGQVSPPAGVAAAVYEYFTSDQAASSDTHLETFSFQPELFLSASNQQDQVSDPWHAVRAGVTLWPWTETISGLVQPYTSANANNTSAPAMPRFAVEFFSSQNDTAVEVHNAFGNSEFAKTNFGYYQIFNRCECYILFPYIVADAPTVDGSGWDTGIAVGNTSDDSGAIVAGKGAPKQAGTVRFWLYDYRFGNLLKDLTAAQQALGIVFPDPPHVKPPENSGPSFDANGNPIYYAGQTLRVLASQLKANAAVQAYLNKPSVNGGNSFAGYVIARAEFQYCHGYAFLSDQRFARISQGYVAQIIPDPSSRGRLAAAAADPTNRILGESLNN